MTCRRAYSTTVQVSCEQCASVLHSCVAVQVEYEGKRQEHLKWPAVEAILVVGTDHLPEMMAGTFDFNATDLGL